MATTAFPRVPVTGRGQGSAPQAIPFDALVQAADVVGTPAEGAKAPVFSAAQTEDADTSRRDAATVARFQDVAPSLSDPETREFLQAIVFLGTRGR